MTPTNPTPAATPLVQEAEPVAWFRTVNGAKAGVSFDRVQPDLPGWAEFPLYALATGVQATEVAPAEVSRMATACKVIKSLVGRIESNECQHKNTHRGGAIWTICDDCDEKWADDRGGFKPYKRPAELLAADKFLANTATEVARDPHAHWIPSADGLSRRNPAPDASVAMVPNSRTVMLKMGTEVASPVVGAASEKRIAAIMALVDEFAIARAHATQHAENAHAVRYRDDVRAEIERSLRLATPSQQEDGQPVGEIVGTEKRGFGAVTVVRWELGFDREKIGTLLYTRATPPARSSVPLTEEQIEKERGAAYSNPDFEAGVRYAEAAHGIVSPQSPQ